MTSWTFELDSDRIAWLTLDKPGATANTLASDVLLELDTLLQQLERDLPRGVVIRSGKSSGFVAGADVREFTTLRTADEAYALVRRGQGVMDRVEALRCPTVALINGFALGGGLELALACRYRVAADDSKLALGLPEVMLGIHPGFGGTVRAVRLLGVRAAMDLMLTGRTVRADRAQRMGLVDRLVPPAQTADAAREIVRTPPSPHRPPLLERALSWAPVRPLIKPQLLKQVASKVRRDHYPAPYAMIDLWAAHGASGTAAYEGEARSISELFLTPTARNLVRVFLLQDRLKALGGKSPIEFRRVHVVGAGVMGGDIAAWCALRGLEVTLQDRELKYVEPAMQRARELFAKRVKDPQALAATTARLRADVAGDGVPEADLVVEAIFENLEAKRALYAQLEPRMKAGSLLASNTSSIVLEPLAEKLARPERFVGLHFFNPVPQMPLVEIIKSAKAAPETVQAAIAFTRKLDKLPLPCLSAPGFIVNRVLMPYLNEAMIAATAGVALPVIDQAALDFGMPMGPIELADNVGLDVALHVGEIVARELGRDAPDATLLKSRVDAKKLGRKTGEGFYLWRDGKVVRPPAGGVAPDADLADRLILALVNESVACLREGIAEDADLIDAAMIFGAGFAPFRGGPIAYARARGVAAVVARLNELAARYGSRFRPDPGWTALL